MKLTCFISVSVRAEQAGAIEPVVSRLGLSGSWRHAFPSDPATLECELDAEDDRIPFLRDTLSAAGLDPIVHYDAEYDEDELRGAELLEFAVESTERQVVHEADMFDLSLGCPRCRAGAPQIGSLKIRPSMLPKRSLIFQSISLEYFVAESLHRALDQKGLMGLELLPLLDTEGQRLPWWQMVPRHVMPPMAPEQIGWLRRGARSPCEVCGRDSYCVSDRIAPPQIAYRRSQLAGRRLPDVAETWECQGVWTLEPYVAPARGRLVVSSRVFQIFREMKVPRVEFCPVHIVEHGVSGRSAMPRKHC